MKKLLVTAAISAFLATPALAQDHRDGGGRDNHQGAPAQAAAPTPAAPSAPAAAPAPAATPRGLRTHQSPPTFAAPGRPGTGRANAPAPANAMRPGDHFDNNRPNNRPDNNRPNNNRPNFNNNNHNWNSYNRNFNASRRFHAPAYHRPAGWYAHRWGYGDRLPSAFWASQYWLNDFFDYGLMSPPPGTVWVRYGDDALLIDRYTGEVIQVEYGVFY